MIKTYFSKILILVLVSILFGLLSLMSRQHKVIKNQSLKIQKQEKTITLLLSDELIDCEIIKEANEILKAKNEKISNSKKPK